MLRAGDSRQICIFATLPINNITSKYLGTVVCISAFSPSLQQGNNALPQSQLHSNLTDEDLLRHYRSSGNNTWLGILLQRYTLLLLGVAMKYLKDKDAAQDAVQQIFLKALMHLPQGEIQNFKGWLYILMRNHCLQLLRDKTRLADEETLQFIAASPDTKEELLLHEATLEQMEEALCGLAGEQKICVAQFYLQKQSYQQIMEATGFTFAQVKSHIQNGKRNLKIVLEKKLAN